MESSEEDLKKTRMESNFVKVQMEDYELPQRKKGKKRVKPMKLHSYVVSYDIYQMDHLLEDLIDFEMESNKIAEFTKETVVLMQAYNEESTNIEERVDQFFQDEEESQPEKAEQIEPVSEAERVKSLQKLSEEYFSKLNKLSFEDKAQLKKEAKMADQLIDYSKIKRNSKSEEPLTDAESEPLPKPSTPMTMEQLLPFFLNSSQGPTNEQLEQMVSQVKLAFSQPNT